MNDQAFLPPRDGDDASYAWLDEWLCEYVDGTMDPSLRAVFETYVDANPDLKAHIEQLNETRDLLGQRGTPSPPSPEKRRRVCNRVQSRVCRKVECDMLRQQASVADLIREHSRAALGIASSLVVALVVGIFTGALLFGPQSSTSGSPLAATPSVTSDGASSRPSAASRSAAPSATDRSSSARASSTQSVADPSFAASSFAASTSPARTSLSTSTVSSSVRSVEPAAAITAVTPSPATYTLAPLALSSADQTLVQERAVAEPAGVMQSAEEARASGVRDAPGSGAPGVYGTAMFSGALLDDGDELMTPWPGGITAPSDAPWSWSRLLTGPAEPFLPGGTAAAYGAEPRAERSAVLTSRR
jgi:hypothetical protein